MDIFHIFFRKGAISSLAHIICHLEFDHTPPLSLSLKKTRDTTSSLMSANHQITRAILIGFEKHSFTNFRAVTEKVWFLITPI